MEDKRRHPRAPCNLDVSCAPETPSADGAGPYQGKAKDLGPGGMFIESAGMPKFGDKLVITLRLPGTQTDAQLPAVVRWSTPLGFGVQFGLLGARDTHAITQLMKQSQ